MGSLSNQEMAAIARDGLQDLTNILRSHRGQPALDFELREHHEPLHLPMEALEVLREALVAMARGNTVMLVPVDAELSTQEAADFLNVSRPHVIKLLERGDIPFVKAGSHRRVRFEDLKAYKEQRDAKSREALKELSVLAQEMESEF